LEEEEIPSWETFQETWKSKFPELKIPKYNTLGACNKCTQIKNHQEAFRKNSPEWNNLRKELCDHIKQVRKERMAQQTRDSTSVSFPHVQ
jgi:hypothetical protein